MQLCLQAPFELIITRPSDYTQYVNVSVNVCVLWFDCDPAP